MFKQKTNVQRKIPWRFIVAFTVMMIRYSFLSLSVPESSNKVVSLDSLTLPRGCLSPRFLAFSKSEIEKTCVNQMWQSWWQVHRHIFILQTIAWRVVVAQYGRLLFA